MAFDRETFAKTIQTEGLAVIPGVLSSAEIQRLTLALEKAMEKEVAYHGGTTYSDYGMVLLCSLYDRCFIDLFDNPLVSDPFDLALSRGSIVYAYTSSSIPPRGTNYSRRIHVDSPRLIPNYMTNMGMTLALTDFTEENGAPWYLPRSHHFDKPPADADFYKNAIRFTAKAGTAMFFNARTWHTSDLNRSAQWRHALTVNMCRPFMKQRLDIPRAMQGIDLTGVSDRALQKLGFLAQVPASYDEYYAPFDKRKFKQKAE